MMGLARNGVIKDMLHRALATAALLVGMTSAVGADDPLPFPQNRVRDFYARQARQFLASDKPLPDLLPEFPGLDGGTSGHWGQNPEADNFDHALNDVDLGGLLSQVVNHFGKRTLRAVVVRVPGEEPITALFDASRLTFSDVWRGDMVKWDSRRYGINSGVAPAGDQLMDLSDSEWQLPPRVGTKYLGFYRSGEQVVFAYQIGTARIYDRIYQDNGDLVRSLTVDGDLPPGVSLTSKLVPVFDDGETMAFTRGGEPQWADQTVTMDGELGTGNGPYLIDTLAVPYRQQNPFGTPMRMTGVDFLPDGRAAVSTLMGDVWLVDGIDKDLDKIVWTRIAAGLHQTLGLIVKDGKILVVGRDQITRLHDLNGDDEADFYECVTNEYPIASGNSFALTLHQDRFGNLYWFTRSDDFGVTQFSEGSRPRSIGNGLRGTNGLGVSDDGQIVFSTVQEGRWTPASAIFEVGAGSYHGFHGPRAEFGKYGYQLPMCFIPRGVDNSSGDITFLPDDERLGPLAGSIIGTSFGYCQHYLVLREEIGDSVQGGVVPLPGEFLSGAHRARFNPRDGYLYVAGTDGWQSYAKENGSLQRVRYVGGDMSLPSSVETYQNGLLVRFNCAVDPASVSAGSVFCEQWNYLYSEAYGSPEYSVRNPGRRGHDHVPVRSVHVLEDGRSVFVEIPHLHPVMQFHLYMELRTLAGQAFRPDIYYSIFRLREPFTDFEGYSEIARRKRYPDFPVAEAYPQDPRLLAQEQLGKSVAPFFSVRLNAVPGLQYEPRRLRVPPGRRIALTFGNADVSMPHNFVLVHPERLQTIGESAMLLAADPRGIATHYVPNDPGVLCFSPILSPGDQYSIYFDSPSEKGAYPFVCTYPGHWQVMRGILYVADENDELPAEPVAGPTRQFVKMWKTADLAEAANQLGGRSLERGRETFHSAGCIKCHALAGEGQKLGPDLTKVTDRFRGAKLLEQILEPSSEINKEYRSVSVFTIDGKVITGLLVEESPHQVRLLPNPLEPKDVKLVRRSDIDEIVPSTVSTMPKGLLMTFSRDEILDLLAFIEASAAP